MNNTFCKCLAPISLNQRFFDICDELIEFVIALMTFVILCIKKLVCDTVSTTQLHEAYNEVCDEASDIMFGIGRFIGNLRGVVYIPIPGDKRHVDKITSRFTKTGCCRSMNHPGCR